MTTIIISHPAGLKYNDQACGSQAQADWFVAAGIKWWIKGRMVGYADSDMGYSANMQPALAVSATAGSRTSPCLVDFYGSLSQAELPTRATMGDHPALIAFLTL